MANGKGSSKADGAAIPAQTPVAQAAQVTAAPIISAEQRTATSEAAGILAKADLSFEQALASVATTVARALGTTPTFDQWEAVAAEFQRAYVAARACTEESARKRWVAVAGEMERQFSLTKPAKPTKAGQAKAAQRDEAHAEASALIERAQAATPAAILALATPAAGEPPKAGVVNALAKLAADKAKEATAAASEAAKERAKTLRDAIREALPKLNVAQLQSVLDLIVGMQPKVAAPVVPAATPEAAPADAAPADATPAQ